MTEPADPRNPRFAVGGRMEPGRFVFANSDEGCTLFIPRVADPQRSASIVEHARRWYRGEATS